ncbi:hypothetical protein RRU01S_39_00150 [Agrobacterium rubi TR3 = NBRC 13261]|uniref:TniQ domain-containing protein n=1 Tax=Agrobacterium rubi TR3 = NBRC 13261 TaxID=1368415 RepID=A0A081D3D9_9HYPH|nr:TniQ family protein [Agrobacterium rubi]MBP1881625.1 hypothetical protein [Agrobacterium rubi]GAK73435.1 hypothetical protein RRU01S_39_00150 [Agrobacterium rubi TR3 = NBRC 13261]
MYHVPLFDDESLTSYCARLAAANVTTATDLCSDMGFSFLQVVAGKMSAIENLSRLGGVPTEKLLIARIVTVGDRAILSGETLSRKDYARTRLRICPDCLRDDDLATERMPGTRRYGRRTWPLRFLRTCPKHHRALADLGSVPLHSPRCHDFIECMEAMYDEFAVATFEAVSERRLSAFEEFIVRRLDGVRQDGVFLDNMPLGLAGQVCELIGTAALFGAKAGETQMNDEMLWAAGRQGYEYLSTEMPGLRSFLDHMHRSSPAVRSDAGGGTLYGTFYKNLSRRDEPELDLLKKEIHRYAFATLPLSGEADVFGKPRVTRYLSEKQLQDVYGIRPGHMRKLAVAAGLLDPAMIKSGAMPLEVAKSIGASLADSVLPAEAADILGLRYPTFKALRRDGMFAPISSSGNGVAMYERFSRQEISQFIEDIAKSATQPVRAGHETILATAKKTRAKLIEIIGLLRQGLLCDVAFDPAKKGLSGILINPEEAHAALVPQRGDRLTLAEMRTRLKTSNEAILGLVNAGHLDSYVERHPMSNVLASFINKADAETFESTYVSFINAEREYAITRTKLRAAIHASQLEPAFPLSEVPVSFYVRKDLVAALETLPD